MYEVDRQVWADARERIARERMRDVRLALRASDGATLDGARVSVRLVRHAFRFGANGFMLRGLDDRELLAGYEERFVGLLNSATLPFYLGSYEPEPGRTNEAHLREMAEWCCAHGIATKGHPLVWHEAVPAWAEALSDDAARRRLRDRVTDLVSGYRGLVNTWDVINEATVSHRYDNVVGRWVREKGALAVVSELVRLAREANPDAELLYNDFNLRCPDFFIAPARPDCDLLVEGLLDAGVRIDALGLQSHMHTRTWSLDEALNVCDFYAQRGLPLHFTELTVLSGRPKDPKELDWSSRHDDWRSTPEGEAAQAEYGEALYTVLFSHPAVEAITWWDFADYDAWQGAPSGLIRADMTPKPLYDRLQRLIRGDWASRYDGVLSGAGANDVTVRCVAGQHAVEVILPSGDTLAGAFTVAKEQTGPVTVALA